MENVKDRPSTVQTICKEVFSPLFVVAVIKTAVATLVTRAVHYGFDQVVKKKS